MAAWTLTLYTLNSLYQLTLPCWVKARGMSFYLIVFQGDNAISSAALGIMAQHAGLTPALLTVAMRSASAARRSAPGRRLARPRRSPPPQAPNPQRHWHGDHWSWVVRHANRPLQ